MEELSRVIAPFLPYLLAVNLFLTLVDASVGYHVAPLLVSSEAPDDGSAQQAARWVRRLLAGVVALYAFLSCFAYFQGQPLFLAGITAVILLDIGSQIFIRRRMGGPGAE
jgi:hypothetical protein